MNAHYPELWRQLRIVGRYEKFASEAEGTYAPVCQERLAQECSAIFDLVRSKAAEYVPNIPGLPSKLAEAYGAARFVTSCMNTHARLGEKVAADPAPLLWKLATAFYLDDVFTDMLEKSAGAKQEATYRARSLGREFAVELMRELMV